MEEDLEQTMRHVSSGHVATPREQVNESLGVVQSDGGKAQHHQHHQHQQQQGNGSQGDDDELSGLELFVSQMSLMARELMAVHLSYEDIVHLALTSKTMLRWYRELMASVHAAWRWDQHSIQAHDATVRSLQYYLSHFHHGKLGTQTLMILLVPLLRENKIDCASLVWQVFGAKHEMAQVMPQHVRAMGVDLSRILIFMNASPKAMRWFREEARPVLFPKPEAWRERVCEMAHSAVLYKELDLFVNICENEPEETRRDLRHAAVTAIRLLCQRDEIDILDRLHASFRFTLDDLHPLDIDTAFHDGSQSVINFLVDAFNLPASCRASPQAWREYVMARDNDSDDSGGSDEDERTAQAGQRNGGDPTGRDGQRNREEYPGQGDQCDDG